MCLTVNAQITNEVLDDQWPLKAYKVVEMASPYGRLGSPYQYHYTWQAGVNQSSVLELTIPFTPSPSDIGTVEHGFHVYLHRETAEKDCTSYSLVIEVICEKKDFIAAGYDNNSTNKSAVFSKVTLPQETYDDAVQSAIEVYALAGRSGSMSSAKAVVLEARKAKKTTESNLPQTA